MVTLHGVTYLRFRLYPELEHFGAESRAEVLKRARRQPFDWVEVAGLGVSIVFVTSLTGKLARAGVAPELLGTPLGNFLLAIPLLAITAGPFYWRRTRRALRDELTHRGTLGRKTP